MVAYVGNGGTRSPSMLYGTGGELADAVRGVLPNARLMPTS
jgi:hypothetical protein